MQMHRYTNQEKQFMEEYVPGHSYAEIQKAFTEKFGWNISNGQIKSFIGRHHLHTGRTGWFEKGQVPYNKGRKGTCATGCEKTWFKKGNIPKNHRPVGSERVTRDGYIEIKTEEPNIWKLKHRAVWEAAHGPIPKGCIVIFRDNDKTNCNLDNLLVIKRSINVVLNHEKMSGYSGDFKDVAVKIAELKEATKKAKKKVT